MIVSGIVKSSLVDYPALISCVLFTPGCNYDCFYCHNRPLLSGPHEIIDWKKILIFLKKRVGQLDGVVITGGEPTLQEDLLSAIAEIKLLGYKVKLDTNGSAPHVIKKALQAGLCDYYAVDYKAPRALYGDVCSAVVDADSVLDTIGMLLEHQVDFEVRTTVIPQLSGQDLITMAQELPELPLYVLNRYRRPETFKESDRDKVLETPYTQQQIMTFAEAMHPWQPNITT